MIPLLLATLCTLPQEAGLVRDEVDVIEVNALFSETGSLTFEQLIFWSFQDGEYRVVSWRMVKCRTQLPVLVNGRYQATWMDGEALRTVTAPSVRWTWTQWDVELAARAILPQRERRGLTYAPQERR